MCGTRDPRKMSIRQAVVYAVAASSLFATCNTTGGYDVRSDRNAGHTPATAEWHAKSEAASTSAGAAESSLPADPDVVPVSLSNLTDEAARVLELCRVDQQATSRVAGIGQIARARDSWHYVRLGSAPELQSDLPAWIVQIRGEVGVHPTMVMVDPTCVVVGSEALFFGTGPVRVSQRDGSTVTVTPMPVAQEPDRALPALAP